MDKLRKRVLTFQGLYYLLTAIWPLVHIPSFLWLTGFKTDIWLVKTVGMLILCIALALLLELYTGKPSLPVGVLGFSCCVGFPVIDLYYTLNGTIHEIYLLDAILQLLLLCGWIAVRYFKKRNTP